MYVCSPPLKPARSTSIEYREEDEDSRNRHGAVHGRAQDEVVLFPPQSLPLLHPQAKHQSHDAPATIVDAGRRRDVVERTEEQRYMDVLQPLGVGKHAALENEHNGREHGAHEEEPQQGPVQGARRKEAPRSDGAPYHAGVEVGARKGTLEPVVCLVSADVGDVVESPVEDCDLRDCAHYYANGLYEEELSSRDLPRRKSCC